MTFEQRCDKCSKSMFLFIPARLLWGWKEHGVVGVGNPDCNVLEY